MKIRFTMNAIFLTIVAFTIFTNVPEVEAETKSHVWTSNRILLSECDGFCGDRDFVEIYTTVKYGARLIDGGGNPISDGAVLTPGTVIKVEQIPYASSDIAWFTLGQFYDSPYGYWIPNSTLSGNALQMITTDGDNLWLEETVNPPTPNYSITGLGLSCTTSDTCTVTAAGPITATVSFPTTTGKFHINGYFDGHYLTDPAFQAFGATTVSDITTDSFLAAGDEAFPPFVLNVPARSFTWNLTAVASNTAPTAPTITPQPFSGNVSTAYPWTAVATDPDGDQLSYQFDWNDDGIPDQNTGTVNSGTSQVLSNPAGQWNSPGTFTFRVRSVDTNGGVSGWGNAQVTVAVPVYSCTGLPTNATMCFADDSGLSGNTPSTVVSSCGPALCEFTCNSGFIQSGNSCVPTQCNDGIDNADPEDTFIDLADPGCTDINDNDEANLPPPVPTADISATGCTILAGDTGCAVAVNWSSTDTTLPSVRRNGVQFSTSATNPNYTDTLIPGTYTYTFHDNGVLLDTSVPVVVECELGTSWDSDSCELPLSPQPDLTPTPLALSAGPYTESVPLTFTAGVQNTGTATGFSDDFTYQWNGTGGAWQNFPGNTVAHGVLAQGASATDGPISFTPGQAGDLYIQHCVDSYNEIDEGAGETPNCTVNGPFMVSLPPPSVTLNAGGCEISPNESTCGGNVYWEFNDIPAPPNYLVTNITTNSWSETIQTSGGNIQRSLQRGANTIRASANGLAPVEREVIADCDGVNAIWYGGICAPAPDFTITANPKLIRSGNTTTVTIATTSVSPLTCDIYGAESTPRLGESLDSSTPITIDPTKPIKNKQIISVTCTDTTTTGLSTTKEIAVEVVPTIEEN